MSLVRLQKCWRTRMIHGNIVFPSGVSHTKSEWPHLSKWFMVSFSMVAFRRRIHFGGCRCVGLPFLYHGKGNSHHWYTTHGSRQHRTGSLWYGDCEHTHTHINRHSAQRSRGHTKNTVCVWMGVNMCVNLNTVWCVWAVLLLFSLWQLNHRPPPFPAHNLRRWLVHTFPQLYGPVPGDRAVMCFIDMLQVTP